jgi:SAM-dependent methyltransferase
MIVEKISPRTKKLEKCPVCQSKDTKFFFSSPDRLHNVSGEFSYHQCNFCQTVFQNPMIIPEDLHLVYVTDYYTHTSSGNKKESLAVESEEITTQDISSKIRKAIISEVLHTPNRGIWKLVGKFATQFRFLRERAFFVSNIAPHYQALDEMLPRNPDKIKGLEIGCGSGDLLYTLQKTGWEMEAVEWDPTAAKKASEKNKCNIWIGDFREIDLPKNKYDLIVLNHVFEHLNSPVQALQRIYDLLAPNGRIVLIYPNPYSIDAKKFKEFWMPWETPRHLVFPSQDAIKYMVKTVGNLKLYKMYSLSRAFLYNLSHSRIYQSGKDNKKLSDYVLNKFVGLLCYFGIKIGSELVVVVDKKN